MTTYVWRRRPGWLIPAGPAGIVFLGANLGHPTHVGLAMIAFAVMFLSLILAAGRKHETLPPVPEEPAMRRNNPPTHH